MSDSIRVSIGSEPLQRVPAKVLRHSILSRTQRPVEFLESWDDKRGWHPLMERAPRLKNGTGFNTWRWLTPQYYGTGKAIYLDSDQCVLADISDLWDSLPESKTIAAVCNAVGVFGPKKIPEPGKVQTSVMVMDCAALKERARIALAAAHQNGKLKYKDLMQATWLPRDEVHELPPWWNMFGICPEGTKLIHYSHVSSQPWRENVRHPAAEVWWRELRAAVEAEYVTTAEVAQEVERGHIAPVYLKRLRRDAA